MARSASGGAKGRGDVWLALRVALVYGVLATLWILLSDRAIGWLHFSGELALRVASIKGMGFVVVTATLLFLLAFGYVRRIRRSEEQYANLFDHAVEGLTVFRVVRDQAGQVTDLEIADVNPTQQERAGRPRSAIVGARMTAAGELDERTRAYFEAAAAAIGDGRPARSELHVLGEDLHELVEVYPVAEDTWALAALDITERKSAPSRRSGASTPSSSSASRARTARAGGGQPRARVLRLLRLPRPARAAARRGRLQRRSCSRTTARRSTTRRGAPAAHPRGGAQHMGGPHRRPARALAPEPRGAAHARRST